MLKTFWIALLFCASLARNAQAAGPYETAPVGTLIDSLTLIDQAAPGISPMGSYDVFIAADKPPEFESGVLGVPPPVVVPQMRELVRRGVAVLPALIAHLDDPRPTRLVIKREGILIWAVFAMEYEPRAQADRHNWRGSFDLTNPNNKVPREYTVKVGDVCYALIGQIVNRRLWPVRYQPTGGLVVNSPIQSSILIEKISKDWGHVDREGHKEALLEDIRYAERFREFAPALVRLKFYYPAAYNALSGKDLEKRIAFETNDQLYGSGISNPSKSRAQ